MLTDIWSFKHEPKDIKDMVLHPTIRTKLEKALIEVPNLMLYGVPGVGKGTFTNILLKKTGFDHMWINASDETGIDNIRNKVKSFSTALGITDMKIVVFNEADSLSLGVQGAQKMLKQLMEDVQKICRFVFLTNEINYMTDAIMSRCRVIEISNPPEKELVLFLAKILKKESVKFDSKTLVSIMKKCYPDIRKSVEVLKENTVNGILASDEISTSEKLFKNIFESMMKQDVEEIRRLLRSNFISYVQLYEYLYENAGAFKSPGGAILAIGDHLGWHKEYPIKEINFMRMVFRMIWEKIL